MLGILYFLGILLLIIITLLITFLFMLPWIGFSVPGIGKDIEKGILERFNQRMNYTIGMSLPPYVAEYNEPTTCMNGSFYGAVKVKFKESLSDVFLSEFQNRLKIASQKLLWRDGDLNTRMVLFQYKDIDEIWLYYCRRHWWEDKKGDFRIKDHKALTYNEYNAPVNKWENQTDMPNGSETIQTILGKIVTTPQNEKKPEMGNMQESNTEI